MQHDHKQRKVAPESLERIEAVGAPADLLAAEGAAQHALGQVQ